MAIRVAFWWGIAATLGFLLGALLRNGCSEPTIGELPKLEEVPKLQLWEEPTIWFIPDDYLNHNYTVPTEADI